MTASTFQHTLAALLSLTVFLGVVVHDTQLDRAVVTAIGLPLVRNETQSTVQIKFGDPHTHTERLSLGQMTSTLLHQQNARLHPRAVADRRSAFKKISTHHTFDGALLPV